MKLAQKHSKDQVDLGYFTKEMMVPEFSEAAFKMNKGEYSKKPVKTQFGYHVILVEDVRASKPLTLAEVEPQLKNMVTQQAIANIFEELRNNAKVEKYTLEGELIADQK